MHKMQKSYACSDSESCKQSWWLAGTVTHARNNMQKNTCIGIFKIICRICKENMQNMQTWNMGLKFYMQDMHSPVCWWHCLWGLRCLIREKFGPEVADLIPGKIILQFSFYLWHIAQHQLTHGGPKQLKGWKTIPATAKWEKNIWHRNLSIGHILAVDHLVTLP